MQASSDVKALLMTQLETGGHKHSLCRGIFVQWWCILFNRLRTQLECCEERVDEPVCHGACRAVPVDRVACIFMLGQATPFLGQLIRAHRGLRMSSGLPSMPRNQCLGGERRRPVCPTEGSGVYLHNEQGMSWTSVSCRGGRERPSSVSPWRKETMSFSRHTWRGCLATTSLTDCHIRWTRRPKMTFRGRLCSVKTIRTPSIRTQLFPINYR